MWTIHYNMAIFITFKTSDIGATTCYMTLFLALKTAIFFLRHNVDHGRWNECGCEVLCGLKSLNFRYSICEGLWSLFINVGG